MRAAEPIAVRPLARDNFEFQGVLLAQGSVWKHKQTGKKSSIVRFVIADVVGNDKIESYVRVELSDRCGQWSLDKFLSTWVKYNPWTPKVNI